MPFPAKMLVDYIKVMKWGEYGEVNEGPPEFQGVTLVFTDLTPTDNGLTPGLDAEIYVWEGTLTEGDIQPYEEKMESHGVQLVWDGLELE